MITLSSVELFNAASDFVAAVAVVISLFYVAKQLRLNTIALKASAAWDSEVAYGNINYEMGLNSENSLLFVRVGSSDAKIEDFDEAEQAQVYFAVRGALQLAQAQWWLWKSGNLPDELWYYRRLWAKNFISSPVVMSVWKTECDQHIFAKDFIADIEAVEQKGKLSFSPA